MANGRAHEHGVVGSIGPAFLSLLLALIVRGMLEALLVDRTKYTGWDVLSGDLALNYGRTALITAQVLVFLSVVCRFYMGSLRLHQESQDEISKLGFFHDLAGTLVLFSLFYVAGIFIRNEDLFFKWLFFTVAVSTVFSVVVCVLGPPSLRRIWAHFLVFDLMTAAVLGAVAFSNPIYSVRRWGALLIVAIIGIWDVRSCWPFYIDAKGDNGWQAKFNRS